MPLSFRSIRLRLVLTKTVFILILCLPTLVQGETKTIVSEASYAMGDGETPSFAEAMVLRKAKNTALEQAGTYVESYTKVRNMDLTAEEIQTIAGGVVQVDVLKKKRSAVGEGFQFFIKIKATVTTDKMEELAQRVRGRNVAEEYKQLQDNYARLSTEFETLKMSLVKIPAGPGRDAALDQIREREREFRGIQQSEVTFFERLISGETLFSNALAQKWQKETERQVVDNLFKRVVTDGHAISFGEPTIHVGLENEDAVGLIVPVTITITKSIRLALEETARSLGGMIVQASIYGSHGVALRMGNDPRRVHNFQDRIANLMFVMEARLTDGSSTGCYIAPQHENYRYQGQVGTLGIAPVSFITRGTAGAYGMKIERLGRTGTIDASSIILELRDDEGYILIMGAPVNFTLGTRLSLKSVKQIKSLTGKIVEGRRSWDDFPTASTLGLPEELEQCSIAYASSLARHP